MRATGVNSLRSTILILTLTVGYAPAARAQTFGCAQPDGFSQDLLDRITVVATDSSLADDRDLFGLVLVPANELEVVTDTVVCRQAGLAYARAIGDTAHSRSVHVVRAGTRYVVTDREEVAGEWLIAFTFDSTFSSPLKEVGV